MTTRISHCAPVESLESRQLLSTVAGGLEGDVRGGGGSPVIAKEDGVYYHFTGQSDRAFGQGNFHYNGLVDFDDLLMLAQPCNTSVIVALPSPTTRRRSASVWA